MKTEIETTRKRIMVDPDKPESWKRWGQGLKMNEPHIEGCPGSGVLGPAELAGMKRNQKKPVQRQAKTSWGNPGWGE